MCGNIYIHILAFLLETLSRSSINIFHLFASDTYYTRRQEVATSTSAEYLLRISYPSFSLHSSTLTRSPTRRAGGFRFKCAQGETRRYTGDVGCGLLKKPHGGVTPGGQDVSALKRRQATKGSDENIYDSDDCHPGCAVNDTQTQLPTGRGGRRAGVGS